MSIPVRNYIKEYIQTCIDFHLGTGKYESLENKQKDNINHYVELKLYNRIRPIGAAPVLNAESPACAGLLEMLKEIGDSDKKVLARIIIKDVESYISDAQKKGKSIGDEIKPLDDIMEHIRQKEKEKDKKQKEKIEVLVQ